MVAVMANRGNCNSREQASHDGVRGRNVVRELEFVRWTHPSGGHCHSWIFFMEQGKWLYLRVVPYVYFE